MIAPPVLLFVNSTAILAPEQINNAYRKCLNKHPGANLTFLLLRGALIRDGHLFERSAYNIFIEK